MQTRPALAAPRCLTLALLRPPMPVRPRLLRPGGASHAPTYTQPRSPHPCLCRALWGRGGKKNKRAEEEEELAAGDGGDWVDDEEDEAAGDTPYALSPAEEVAAEKAAYAGHQSGVAEAEEERTRGV